MPQWDASETKFKMAPFFKNKEGICDFYNINDNYFDHAAGMLDVAVKKGFIPALVILWCDYVKDTWASKIHGDHIMPIDSVKPYVEYVLNKFAAYNPIYIISGDTDFGSDDTKNYYKVAFDTIKSLSPQTLTTMHLTGGLADIPQELDDNIDFYMYQSGHKIEEQYFSYSLASNFYDKHPKKPIINSEPCYEGHSYGFQYGRFNEFDIRKAIWQSLLSGAKAGITYGAHGIWSWHKRGREFINAEFAGEPFDWKVALKLAGAWEASFAKWLFDVYNLFDIEPAPYIINQSSEIRMAASKKRNKVLIYIPYNIEVKISIDLSELTFVMINLNQKYFAKPKVLVKNGLSIIKMHDFNSDVLVIGLR